VREMPLLRFGGISALMSDVELGATGTAEE
jgi:hypothetical protein